MSKLKSNRQLKPLVKEHPSTKKMAGHSGNPTVPTTTATAAYQRSRLNVSDTARNNLVAFLAEFLGTFMFLFLAFAGTQVANNLSTLPADDIYDPTILILISLSFGFSLLANVWAFYRVSGGLFNPAVSPRPPAFRLPHMTLPCQTRDS
jgi:aquaporin related protein